MRSTTQPRANSKLSSKPTISIYKVATKKYNLSKLQAKLTLELRLEAHLPTTSTNGATPSQYARPLLQGKRRKTIRSHLKFLRKLKVETRERKEKSYLVYFQALA